MPLGVDFFLFKYLSTLHYLLYLRHHVDAKTSLALPYMANSAKVYCKHLMRACMYDGSTDRCRIAIVTNQRALLSGSDQPERKLGRLRILCVRRENKLAKTATFAQWYMVHC